MSHPYLSIHLHEVVAEQVDEYSWWPGNTAIELYQTWSLSDLERLSSDPGAGVEEARWSRLGFSTRGGLRGFRRFRNGDRENVIDPVLTLALSEAMKPGDERLLSFDVHHWEQNDASTTEKVKLLSSNESLKTLITMWRTAREDQDRARLGLDVWLEENLDDIAKLALESVAPAAAGVATAFNLIPLLEILFRMALDQADRHLSSHRVLVGLRRDPDVLGDPAYSLRVHGIGASAGPWTDDSKPQEVTLPLVDDDGGNRLSCTYRVQLVA